LFKKLGLENHTQFFIFIPILLVKFFIVRSLLFEDTNLFHTIALEIGYLLLIFGLVEFLTSKKLKNILYIAVNLILTILLVAILIYHDYYGYIVTVHAFSLLGQVGAVKDSVFELIDPIYFVLFVDFVLLILYAFIRRNSPALENKAKNSNFVVAMVFIGMVLTGLNLFMQKDNQIANTVVAAQKQGILTYEILAARELTGSEAGKALTIEEKIKLLGQIREVKGIVPVEADERRLAGIAKDKNVIVIQAEAFQAFALNLEVDGAEITPFLNDLMQESLYFPNVYQQIGQGNTSDAEFIFNTAAYAAPWTASSETYGDREIPSFPKLLRDKDYKSLTFHANEVSFWSRDSMYPALGFDQYYDIEFFGKEDVIGIGPSDEVLYEKALPELVKLHEQDQKFYAQFITLTSHHPFKVPADKDVIELPEKFDGSIVGDYLKSLNYLDSTLQDLVADLKAEGMWEDTVFVIYGDHFGLQPSGLKEGDFPLLKELVGHDYTFLDQFNIPFMVTIGDQKIGEINETVGGQIDMMPTVANLIGLSLDQHVHFGQDLVNYPNNLFGMRYYMPYGSFFNDEIAFKPAEGFADGEAFNLETGEPLKNFAQYEEDYNRILELLKLADDYMGSLPVRE
jgi:lipoteichoic acid synthase